MTDQRDVVKVERREHILIVTISRPDVLNAVDGMVSEGVARAMAEAEADEMVRAVILTGQGERAFSAGGDLAAIASGANLLPSSPELIEWGFGGCTGRQSSKPVIAAVNGIAFGGGFEMVLAADLVVADSRARFALPEVTKGVIAGWGGARLLPRAVPRAVALELLLTGAPIDAHRACALGLVNEVVEPGQAVAMALTLAQRIADNAPIAVQASKVIARSLDAGWSVSGVDAVRSEAALFQRVMESEDAREGPRAFLQKRAPRWSGQ